MQSTSMQPAYVEASAKASATKPNSNLKAITISHKQVLILVDRHYGNVVLFCARKK